MGAFYAVDNEDADPTDGGAGLEDDRGADGWVWWRDVDLWLPDNVRRVKDGACPVAVLRE